MGKFYEATIVYLSLHPEIRISYLELMDKIYIEIITKNALVYSKSFVINMGNHLLGSAELNTLKYRGVAETVDTQTPESRLAGGSLLNSIFWIYNTGLIIFNSVIFWLFLPSLAFFAVKWKSLPAEVVISFLISSAHFTVLAFFADPAHRFRYPIDPFIYFLQFYLILLFFGFLFAKYIKNPYNL